MKPIHSDDFYFHLFVMAFDGWTDCAAFVVLSWDCAIDWCTWPSLLQTKLTFLLFIRSREYRTGQTILFHRNIPLTNRSVQPDSPRGDDAENNFTFEIAPGSGANDPMTQCLIVRDRSGLKRMNPEYLLYLQDG